MIECSHVPLDFAVPLILSVLVLGITTILMSVMLSRARWKMHRSPVESDQEPAEPNLRPPGRSGGGLHDIRGL